MRAVEVSRPGGEFRLVEREIPEPGAGTVRIRVEACGVCHSDSLAKEGHYPGIRYPIVPGHEVIGVIDAVGPETPRWKPGQRVGAGWNGGYCGYCDACRRGHFFACQSGTDVTGVTRDGGYADYVIVPYSALAAAPDGLPAEDLAPLMCAGVTTFNCLRNSGARPGDVVAIHGLGGLGHLGVQFAAKMGFRTVSIARGGDKEALVRQLGAVRYLDSQAVDAAGELARMGGAKAILATVTNAEAMQSLIGGLGLEGTLFIIGAVPTLAVPPLAMLRGRQAVKGWYSGTAIDSEDTMAFAALTGVRSMNEVFPLDQAQQAYERMMSGRARFRAVLRMAA